jgi:hypothetical protein
VCGGEVAVVAAAEDAEGGAGQEVRGVAYSEAGLGWVAVEPVGKLPPGVHVQLQHQLLIVTPEYGVFINMIRCVY